MTMPVLRDPQHELFCRLLAEEHLRVPAISAPIPTAYERAGYQPDPSNAHRLAARPEIRRRVDELVEEALEYSNIRVAQVAVRLGRIATARMSDYYETIETVDPATGEAREVRRLRDIHTLPDRLAEAIREVDFADDGRPTRIRLHDKLAAASVLMKHLGGFPEGRTSQQVNNTQVNIEITDEQRIAALMALLARAKATTDRDSVPGPVEQLPALPGKSH